MHQIGFGSPFRILALIVSLTGVYAASGQSVESMIPASWTGKSSNAASACRIKGNISFETSERIYHVPGQRYYLQTVISPDYGERWFCSESEARQAGWRKSRM